jgi:hypothetical protein
MNKVDLLTLTESGGCSAKLPASKLKRDSITSSSTQFRKSPGR